MIGISLQQFPSTVDFKSMVRLNLVRYLLGIEHLTSGTKLTTLKHDILSAISDVLECTV